MPIASLYWGAIQATFGPTFGCSCQQPRDRKSEAFTKLVDYIYKVLTQPDVTPAGAPDQWAELRTRDQRQMRYQMLPHARPGGIAGLLELLLDRGGRDDMYRLADDLAFEIDDLLPMVIAPTQMLGVNRFFDAAVSTPSGEEFANSEILRQKELFRNAAIENVLLLRQIRRALDAKSDHTVPEDFFLDMLGEQFSEEESQLQLQTAVNWGRYAELFDYDSGRRRFVGRRDRNRSGANATAVRVGSRGADRRSRAAFARRQRAAGRTHRIRGAKPVRGRRASFSAAATDQRFHGIG